MREITFALLIRRNSHPRLRAFPKHARRQLHQRLAGKKLFFSAQTKRHALMCRLLASESARAFCV